MSHCISWYLAASGNPFMQSIGALIKTALAASFQSSAPTDDPKRAVLAVEQHARIADAIFRRDPQGAADAMMFVIQQGWTNIGGRSSELARLSTENFSLPLPAIAASMPKSSGEQGRSGDSSGVRRARPSPAVVGDTSS